MSPPMDIGLPEALERAAIALSADADAIRPANGDPSQLIELLDVEGATRVLEWLLANEPSAGCELAEAWIDDSESSAEPVLRANPDGLPKSARKALRRARHRLSQTYRQSDRQRARQRRLECSCSLQPFG